MLALFSLAIWLLSKSTLPKERTADIVLAVCMLGVQILIARNWYVSQRRAEDIIKEVGPHDTDNTRFRSEQEARAALREAAKVCWNAKEGNDAR
jgi:hypothetical protein